MALIYEKKKQTPLDICTSIVETVVYKLLLWGERVEVQPRHLKYFQAKSGAIPFREWLESLDRKPRAGIDARLARVRDGNLGDCEPVGDGVYELKDHRGAGYRIYFGKIGKEIVLLLWGGTKKSQSQDIRRAKEYWKYHLARHDRK